MRCRIGRQHGSLSGKNERRSSSLLLFSSSSSSSSYSRMKKKNVMKNVMMIFLVALSTSGTATLLRCIDAFVVEQQHHHHHLHHYRPSRHYQQQQQKHKRSGLVTKSALVVPSPVRTTNYHETRMDYSLWPFFMDVRPPTLQNRKTTTITTTTPTIPTNDSSSSVNSSYMSSNDSGSRTQPLLSTLNDINATTSATKRGSSSHGIANLYSKDNTWVMIEEDDDEEEELRRSNGKSKTEVNDTNTTTEATSAKNRTPETTSFTNDNTDGESSSSSNSNSNSNSNSHRNSKSNSSLQSSLEAALSIPTSWTDAFPFEDNNNNNNDSNNNINNSKNNNNKSSNKKTETPYSFFSTKLYQPSSWNITTTHNNNNNNKKKDVPGATLKTKTTSTPLGSSSKGATVSWINLNNLNYNPYNVNGKKKSSDTLSVLELESYLRKNGYVRQSDLVGPDSSIGGSDSQRSGGITMTTTTTTTTAAAAAANSFNHTSTSSRTNRTSTRDRKSKKLGTKSSSSISSSPFSITRQKPTGTVAFPQSSVLSYKNVRYGSTVAGALLGIIIGYTILPNLWLMGGIVMATYGYDITKYMATTTNVYDDDEDDDDDDDTTTTKKRRKKTVPTNVVATTIIAMGRKFAKEYLRLYDFIHGMWFMYKTGQLSYQYWKQYAVLDEKFQIQSKMDAWNARFQEGKINFDKWEKENEVGRKVLATLRTIWLVEEQTMKKRHHTSHWSLKSTSRYRMLQYYYNVQYWMTRRTRRVWKAIKKKMSVLGDWSHNNSGFKEFFQGVRVTMGDESLYTKLSTRLGAAVAAMVFVYLTGALFAIVPVSLTFFSILIGIVWPTWFGELVQRLSFFLEETRAIGRGEDPATTITLADEEEVTTTEYNVMGIKKRQATPSPSSFMRGGGGAGGGGGGTRRRVLISVPSLSSPFQRYDNNQYHYYRRLDGTKRFYRTGQPSLFSVDSKQMTKKQKISKKNEWLGSMYNFPFQNNNVLFSNNNNNNNLKSRQNKKSNNQNNNDMDFFQQFFGGGGGGSASKNTKRKKKTQQQPGSQSYKWSWPWEQQDHTNGNNNHNNNNNNNNDKYSWSFL